MVAGGVTFAAPHMMPEAAAADAMLYVSCVNEDFGNTFAGGQICEIIVRDPSIAETDQAEPEPTVEVNNETLRMVQGADGWWYAYIGSTEGVGNNAGGVTANINYGITAPANHEGTSCPVIGYDIANGIGGPMASDYKKDQISCSSAATVYLYNSTSGSSTNLIIDGAPALSDRDQVGGSTSLEASGGQLNVTDNQWPFIQTWEFKDDSDVTIVYEAPGADETVELTYETDGDGMDSYAKLELDRLGAAQGSQIHLTIYDNQLNLDPTVEDSVIFLTNSSQGVSYNSSLAYSAMASAQFGDNGVLKITRNANSADAAVVISQNNTDQKFRGTESATGSSCTGGNQHAEFTNLAGTNTATCHHHHIEFFETSSNSGIFTNTDDADTSTLKVNDSAIRGTSATFDYNDTPVSFVVTNTGAVIDMVGEDAGDEWNSGEEITVVLNDPDRNLNTASDEDLTVSASTRVPTIKTGSPLQIVEFHSAANVTFSDCDETSGICTFSSDQNVYLGGSSASPIFTTTFGNTVGSNADGLATLNGMNSSASMRYVSYDVTDMCVADSVGIAGATSQGVKAVVKLGTADWTAANADMECIFNGRDTTVSYTHLTLPTKCSV